MPPDTTTQLVKQPVMVASRARREVDGVAAAEESATAFAYLRVSSAGQVNKGTDPEGYSIPGQREAVQAKARSLGVAEPMEYVEYGVSGRTTHRPALQQMLADLKELRPTYVIIYDLSRLARNRLDDASLLLKIEASGAKLVSVLENIDSTPAGRLTHGVLAAVNEFRSAGDAEKVMMGLRRKHATGGTVGKAPIGYLNTILRVDGREIRTVEVDAERAPLVKFAFEAYASGNYTISALTDLLEEAGLQTPTTAKRPARALVRSAVHRMLRDDYYRGIVTFEGAKNRGTHEPLISDDLFEAVQAALSAHALSGDRTQKHDHYLKGSVFCPCGRRLIFNRVQGHGGIYYYFDCHGRRTKSTVCTNRYMQVAKVEAAVERYYREHELLTSVERDEVRRAVQSFAGIKLEVAQRENGRAQLRLAQLKSEQQRLLQLHYRGLVDEEVLAAEQARIEHERAQARKWAEASAHDAKEIHEALDEALAVLKHAHSAYAKARPTARRILNQALFARIDLINDDVAGVEQTPWVVAAKAVATAAATGPVGAHTAAEAVEGGHNNLGPESLRGLGCNKSNLVRLNGLEPSRGNLPTRPSTLRVYQFRHRRGSRRV